MNKQQAAEILDELYHERHRLNLAIYHLRRHVLGMNFRKANELINAAMKLKPRRDRGGGIS